MNTTLYGDSLSNIQSIEFLEDVMEMCEITVENEHCYFANDVLTHNCGQEIRVMALMSKEPTWIKSFKNNEDLHKQMAIKMWGEENYTRDLRKKAKSLNFGLIFGMGAGTLAARENLTKQEAEEQHRLWWKAVPKIKEWCNAQVGESKKTGVLYNAFGRPRRLKWYWKQQSGMIKSFAKRTAYNCNIQSCLQAHTLILTNKGYKSIKEVFDNPANLKVWTGTSWEFFTAKYMGKARPIKMFLSDGSCLDCDENHQVLVVDGENYKFKKVLNLDKNDFVCQSYPRPLKYGECLKGFELKGKIHNSNKISVKDEQITELWYWIGHLIGDGWINGKGDGIGFVFGRHERDRFEKMKLFFTSIGFPEKEWEEFSNEFGLYAKIDYYSKGFVDYLVDIFGLKRGKTAHTKEMPSRLWSETLKNRTSFIKGLFDSDGSKLKTAFPSLHLCQKPLLLEVQKIARTCGLKSNVYDCNEEKAYMLHLKWTPDFAKIFPEWTERKVQDSYKTPLNFEMKSRLIESYKKPINFKPRNYAMMSKVKTGRYVSLAGSVCLAERMGVERRDITYSTSTVKNILMEETEVDTYTLTVHSPLHRYDSEGVISKNCGADVLKMAVIHLFRNLLNHPEYKNDVRFLSTIHDEINFGVKKERAIEIIPLLLKDMTTQLPDWEFPLECGLSIGNSWGLTFDFKTEENGEIAPVQA